MVGEIRDAETARIAVESALTGHLVLSTLHTNDAPSAITRLTEMGVEPFLSASALAVVVVMDESVYNVSDASRAVQSMMLTAWDEGVGSNWVGFDNLEWANAVLEIPPELKVLAIVPFGYPQVRLGRGKKDRKPFAEVVSSERYGQPRA